MTSTLKSSSGNMNDGSTSTREWVYESPIHSDVEAKLRRFLVELRNAGKIIGIQVCAYKDEKVIIDTAAGVLGKDDPRPVQPDSLFPVFSVTKGVTAAMVHWLADKGKLKLDENVADIWLEFGKNGKDQIKVHHILNHTSGLQNALAGIEEDPTLLCDWDECLKRIAMVAPETEIGHRQLYHYLSFGWLCGGIIEHASGKKFKDILEEAFVRPLNVEGEFYIGIPPGVESRVATVTVDPSDIGMLDPDLIRAQVKPNTHFLPSSYTFNVVKNIIPLSNKLDVRRAKIPGVNGHFSARALARFYAALVDGGVVPPHHPTLSPTNDNIDINIFTNSKEKIHDAFLGRGDYKDMILPKGRCGLGFSRTMATDGSVIGFGHEGLGGSTGYGDINNMFAISVTLNKLSIGSLTGEIIRSFALNLIFLYQWITQDHGILLGNQ